MGRVADLGRPSPQALRVSGQQRVDPRRPLLRLPLRLPQTPAHGLAVQIQRTSNRPNRRTLTRPTTNLLPPVLSDHVDLPEHLTLRVDRRRNRRHLLLPSADQQASSWPPGNSIVLIDILEDGVADGFNNLELYGEWSPTLSFGRLADRTVGGGPVRDVAQIGGINFDGDANVVKWLPG